MTELMIITVIMTRPLELTVARRAAAPDRRPRGEPGSAARADLPRVSSCSAPWPVLVVVGVRGPSGQRSSHATACKSERERRASGSEGEQEQDEQEREKREIERETERAEDLAVGPGRPERARGRAETPERAEALAEPSTQGAYSPCSLRVVRLSTVLSAAPRRR